MATSAAKRVRARRGLVDPTVYTPPLPTPALLRADLDDLTVTSAGVKVGLRKALQSAAYELTMDGASTLTLAVIDQDDELWTVLDVDEDAILDGSVLAEIGGVRWRLQAVQGDDSAPLSMTFADDIAWRLGRFDKPRKFSRGRYTRASAIYRLVDEARQPPLERFDIYIPELNDRQKIQKAPKQDTTETTSEADGTAGGDAGFSSDATITGTHQRATARQVQVLQAALREAARLGASPRVQIAVVMAITQESVAGLAVGRTGNDDIGIFQQGRNWISAANSRDTAKCTRAFLLGPDAHVGGNDSSVKGWKQRHGSLRTVPGGYESAIKAVQISIGGYSAWESEAKRTVEAFDPGSTSGTGSTTTTTTREIAKAYEFTRGTSEGRESTWTAVGRLTDEINGDGDGSWHRWAVLNAFWYASDNELRQAKPSITLHTDAPWLIRRSYDWNANRSVTELQVTVLARAWGLLPGSVAAVPSTWGPLAGRWIVRKVAGRIGRPEVDITLSRAVSKLPEPPHETESKTTTSTSGSDGAGGGDGSLVAICEHISSQNRPYLYGGGHGKALSQISPKEGLDCSSSCSLALKRADMFPGNAAITSGTFASSWGKPGRGKTFTVYASGEHVFIQFSSGKIKRFDTSPHGSGGSGPHTRTTSRTDLERFTPRHWPGA